MRVCIYCTYNYMITRRKYGILYAYTVMGVVHNVLAAHFLLFHFVITEQMLCVCVCAYLRARETACRLAQLTRQPQTQTHISTIIRCIEGGIQQWQPQQHTIEQPSSRANTNTLLLLCIKWLGENNFVIVMWSPRMPGYNNARIVNYIYDEWEFCPVRGH